MMKNYIPEEEEGKYIHSTLEVGFIEITKKFLERYLITTIT